MRHLSFAHGLRLVLAGLLMLAFAPTVFAQQPSRELQNLQETTRDLYQAGAYDEALDYAQRALQLVMREFGAEHEQTSIQTYSLGLISERAGRLADAERY